VNKSTDEGEGEKVKRKGKGKDSESNLSPLWVREIIDKRTRPMTARSWFGKHNPAATPIFEHRTPANRWALTMSQYPISYIFYSFKVKFQIVL
jgi:hypothetical protein